MVYRNKGKFTLDEQCLQRIVDNIKKIPQNKDVFIEVKKSDCKSSKSLYVRFCLGEFTTMLRISDHNCKGFIRNILVDATTGISHIYSKIDRAIKDLRLKRVYCLMNRGHYGQKAISGF